MANDDMTATGGDRESMRTVLLGTDCTMLEAPSLHERLSRMLDDSDPVVIDATDIERVDAAGVQLLAGFTIDCMERSIVFVWAGRSPVFERAVQMLGVGALMESPGVAASFPGAGQ